MKATYLAAAASIAALTLTSAAGAHTRHHKHHHHHHHAMTHAMPAGTKLMASLDGASETPAADADGTGMFHASLVPGTGKLCYDVTSKMIGTPTMAHIHAGAAGVAGPPVVTIKASAPMSTCMTIDKALAMKIAQSPEDYYVNVHNAAYPNGAIRGQVMKH